ncbi:MAG: hypothetical protein J5I50_05005 [Chitinophagaceae bacterium]|nr:hypothetical protein [Chitinophagaceae bacterium]
MMRHKLFPSTVLFVIVSVLLLTMRSKLEPAGYSVNLILIANVVLFLLTLFTFGIQTRNIHSTSGHAFMRGIYISVIVKMLFVMAALVVYILSADDGVNIKGLFVAMGLYLLYLGIEVYQLMKIARNQNSQ